MPHVMVVSSEGYFYAYNIDLENGGECSLMKQYKYVHGPVTLSRILLITVPLVCWIRRQTSPSTELVVTMAEHLSLVQFPTYPRL